MQRIAPLRLTLAVVALALTACARQAVPAAGDLTASVAERGVAERAARADYSVWDLGSTWRDQRGATVSLGALRGRPRVLAMIYTHCSATCPLTVADMRRIEAATPAAVGLVLVSLDPDRDGSARLAEYAAAHGLAADRWTLLTGADADVRDLAAALGVRYRRLSPAELAHSNTLTVLDADGAVVRQQPGLEGTDETVAALRALAR